MKYRSLSVEQIAELISQKTAQANQRLRRLEYSNKAQSSLAYKWLEKQLYDEKHGVVASKSATPRFNRTNLEKLTKDQLIEELKTVNEFLSSKTSSVGGVNKKYKSAWKTYNEKQLKQGKKALSFQEYSDMHDEVTFREYLNHYGSQEARDLVDKYSTDKNGKKDSDKAYYIMSKINEIENNRELLNQRGLTVIERQRQLEKLANEYREGKR